jgi:hypothetical protein
VLWALDGYAILDIRSDYERESRGPLRAEKGTVNIPLFFAKYVYDSTQVFFNPHAMDPPPLGGGVPAAFGPRQDPRLGGGAVIFLEGDYCFRSETPF